MPHPIFVLEGSNGKGFGDGKNVYREVGNFERRWTIKLWSDK
jgi:hypothetical protein